jgi:hypothetical protein
MFKKLNFKTVLLSASFLALLLGAFFIFKSPIAKADDNFCGDGTCNVSQNIICISDCNGCSITSGYEGSLPGGIYCGRPNMDMGSCDGGTAPWECQGDILNGLNWIDETNQNGYLNLQETAESCPADCVTSTTSTYCGDNICGTNQVLACSSDCDGCSITSGYGNDISCVNHHNEEGDCFDLGSGYACESSTLTLSCQGIGCPSNIGDGTNYYYTNQQETAYNCPADCSSASSTPSISATSTIHAISGGGNWSATSTWEEGVVPTSTNPVVINGAVYLDMDAGAPSLVVNNGAILKNVSASSKTISIIGDVTNNGTISDNASGTLSLNIAGHITNNGTWNNSTVNLVWPIVLGATDYQLYLSDAANTWPDPITVSTNHYTIAGHVSDHAYWRVRATVNSLLMPATDIRAINLSGFLAFSEISFSQTTDAPFAITITSLDLDGSTTTSTSTLAISATTGTTTPASVTLNNGTWTGNISLGAVSTSTKLLVFSTTTDIFGASELFAVQTATSSTATTSDPYCGDSVCETRQVLACQVNGCDCSVVSGQESNASCDMHYGGGGLDCEDPYSPGDFDDVPTCEGSNLTCNYNNGGQDCYIIEQETASSCPADCVSASSTSTVTATSTVHSISAGGNWSATSTWEEGVVPTSTNPVVINGAVYLDANESAPVLTINNGATLKNASAASTTLAVSGNVINNGAISDNNTGFLSLNISGHITNNGVWDNAVTNLAWPAVSGAAYYQLNLSDASNTWPTPITTTNNFYDIADRLDVSGYWQTRASVNSSFTATTSPKTINLPSLFSFSAITSQYINTPFAVTITALDRDGNNATSSGTISLSATNATTTPSSVTLTNGTWTGNVSLGSNGNNVKLIASSTTTDAFGESGAFTVNSAAGVETLSIEQSSGNSYTNGYNCNTWAGQSFIAVNDNITGFSLYDYGHGSNSTVYTYDLSLYNSPYTVIATSSEDFNWAGDTWHEFKFATTTVSIGTKYKFTLHFTNGLSLRAHSNYPDIDNIYPNGALYDSFGNQCGNGWMAETTYADARFRVYYDNAGSAPYCGDNTCNGSETCSSCPADCGECDVIHSTTAGGNWDYAGTWAERRIPTFDDIVEINGLVSINVASTTIAGLKINSNGKLQGSGNNSPHVTINGDFTNNGKVQKAWNIWGASFNIYGDINNSGDWDGGDVNIAWPTESNAQGYQVDSVNFSDHNTNAEDAQNNFAPISVFPGNVKNDGGFWRVRAKLGNNEFGSWSSLKTINSPFHPDFTLNLSSPQKAGQPFSATITAKDVTGATAAYYNGELKLLTSHNGVISPSTINLVNGTWSGNLTIGKGGNDIKIIAYGDNTAGKIAGESESFSVVKRNPVIIVPGTMASYLNSGTNRIWPDVWLMWTTYPWCNEYLCFDPGIDYLHNLILPNDGTPSASSTIGVGNIIKRIDPAPATNMLEKDYYYSLMNELENNGYVENYDLFTFPYDWRLNINTNADLLRQKIAEVKTLTGAAKVNIIAHSQGGLIVKKCIMDCADDQYCDHGSVDKFIDIATPHLGTPEAFQALMFGDKVGVIDPSATKVISQNFPSVYQQLPSRKYVGDASTTPAGSFNGQVNSYIDNPYNFDGNGASNTLDYDRSMLFMASTSRNINLLPLNDALHKQIDDFNPTTYGISAYNIVGCNRATVGKIGILNKQYPGHADDEYSLDYINGDGTVPLWSGNYLPETVGTYYDINDNAEHDTLPSRNGVRQLTASILNGTENSFDFSESSDIRQNTQSCFNPGWSVSFHSPVTLNAYDENGNHVGLTSDGKIEVNIPGAAYDVIETNKFMYLPTGHNYRITGQATDKGTFNARIKKIENDQVVETAYYNELPLDSTSTAVEIDFANQKPNYEMNIYRKGKQSAVSKFNPSSILNKQESSDRIKPNTQIKLEKIKGKMGARITLSPADGKGGSGILKTEYSLNGGETWNLYTDKLALNNDGQYNIQFMTTDRAGNVEVTKDNEISLDKNNATIKEIKKDSREENNKNSK